MVTAFADWEGEELLVRRDRATGAWSIIAIHSTARGPAVGGTRMRPYARPEDAVLDALRLSEGMTLKNAIASLPRGGGKAVIAVPSDLSEHDRTRLLLEHAERVEALGGRFETGPDMGTTESDMDVIGSRTSHVFCRSVAAGGSGTASPWTALGVFHGIRASLAYKTGDETVEGVTVVVQGVGEVGARLAGLLHAHRAHVVICDTDETRVAAVAARLPGVSTVQPQLALQTECDVYAPCAMGGTLSRETIPLLRCQIVAGAANNQLAEPGDAMLLRERNILYAPDFVINGGGIIRGVGAETLRWSDDEIDRHVARIGDVLESIYRDADARSITTAEAAVRLAHENLFAAA